MEVHYVYAHLDEGEPVYVGVGKGGRAWQCSPNSRSEEHIKWMLNKLPENLELQIVASGVSKSEAHSLERQIVYELKPKYNSHIPKYKCKHLAKDNRPSYNYR